MVKPGQVCAQKISKTRRTLSYFMCLCVFKYDENVVPYSYFKSLSSVSHKLCLSLKNVFKLVLYFEK